MDVGFVNSPYLNAVKEKGGFSSDDEVFNYIDDSWQFKSVDISVDEFNDKYSEEGWLGRKVIALPAAIWACVVKTIYHLAEVVILGFFCCADDEYINVRCYYIQRDLQESFGWLATLFSDKYGQYYVQESEFHKSCYDCFLTDNTEFDREYLIDKLKTNPSRFSNLNRTLRSDEDVIIAALEGCKNAEEAKRVFDAASCYARQIAEVVLAFVKIDPALFESLSYDLKSNQDVIIAALGSCKNAEEAKNVLSEAGFSARRTKGVARAVVKIDLTLLRDIYVSEDIEAEIVIEVLESCTRDEAKRAIPSISFSALSRRDVAFALIRIDPLFLKNLSWRMQEDLAVARFAIDRSTADTIREIWNCLQTFVTNNYSIRAKVKEKYPNFFANETFNDGFDGSSSSSGAASAAPWSEPEDLEGQTSIEANTIRNILKMNHSSIIKANEGLVSRMTARGILCDLLDVKRGITDQDLKKTYKKTILGLHPDKTKLPSAEEAFKVLSAAYQKAEL